MSGVQWHLQGRGPLGLNPSGAGEAYSMWDPGTAQYPRAGPCRAHQPDEEVGARKTRAGGCPAGTGGVPARGGGVGRGVMSSRPEHESSGARPSPGSTGHHAHGAEGAKGDHPQVSPSSRGMGQPVPSPGQRGLLTLQVGLWKEPVNDSRGGRHAHPALSTGLESCVCSKCRLHRHTAPSWLSPTGELQLPSA